MDKTEAQIEFLPDEMLQRAADCFKVMAHPVRIRIVNILRQGEYAVHEIADLCGTPASQTCEHLRLMKGHGLLNSRREGRAVYYTIASPQLPGLIDCIRENCGI